MAFLENWNCMVKIGKEKLLLDLYAAYYDARKHKGTRTYVKEFETNLHENLVELRDKIYNRTYVQEPLTCFIINHPKKREVFASKFVDRIVHHLYFNYTHELFEDIFIYDCYSCIKSRGTSFGIDRIKHHIRSESHNYRKKCWVLKLDISSYFMTIDRKLLLNIIGRHLERGKFKENLDIDLIRYLSEVIVLKDPTENCAMKSGREDYIGLAKGKSLFNQEKGKGLPIGNLTSQLFSNVYLNELDQFVKRQLKMKHYGRYVDDFYIVSSDKDKLHWCVGEIRKFLESELALGMNEGKTVIRDVRYGVEFLGVFIKPGRTYISNQCARRIKAKIEEDSKTKTKEEMRQSYISRLGYMKKCNAYNFVKKMVYGIEPIAD